MKWVRVLLLAAAAMCRRGCFIRSCGAKGIDFRSMAAYCMVELSGAVSTVAQQPHLHAVQCSRRRCISKLGVAFYCSIMASRMRALGLLALLLLVGIADGELRADLLNLLVLITSTLSQRVSCVCTRAAWPTTP